MAHKLYIEAENGEMQVITIAETDDNLAEANDDDDDRETYGAKETAIKKLQEIHQIIRFYVKYAIGAFTNLGGAEVEELNLKFGLKIDGETGVPMLTKASAESFFEVEVKCKFPKEEPKKD